MTSKINKTNKKIDKLVYLAIGISFLIVMVGALAIFPSTSNFFTSFIGKTQFPVVNFEELEVDPKQDHYVVCPEWLCTTNVIDEPSSFYNASVEQMRDQLFSFVDNRPNITLKNLNLELQQFDFTEQTPGNSFPDIITVRIIQNENGASNLAIYSRSVIGDVAAGSNKRRIENWLLIFEKFK